MLGFIGNMVDIVGPIMVFSIPIVAIVGGITAGIVRTVSRHRLIELAQRERIAMIERGLDPSKLPPLPLDTVLDPSERWSPGTSARRRSQGLMVGGFVTLAVGISLSVFLYLVTGNEPGVWAAGLIPGAIGLALLVSGILMRPRGEDETTAAPPRAG